MSRYERHHVELALSMLKGPRTKPLTHWVAMAKIELELLLRKDLMKHDRSTAH